MSKFRKKPIVIEAEQWWPGKCIDGVHVPVPGDGEPGIRTLEGYMVVSPGDWIITGVKGEKYPCKDDIFRATYDLVTDDMTIDQKARAFVAEVKLGRIRWPRAIE